MWYDEENGVYQILDNETVLDKEKQTVSYKTTHFSKYMVVDKNIWYNTWRTNIDYRVGTTTKLYYDFAFVVDTGKYGRSAYRVCQTVYEQFCGLFDRQ